MTEETQHVIFWSCVLHFTSVLLNSNWSKPLRNLWMQWTDSSGPWKKQKKSVCESSTLSCQEVLWIMFGMNSLMSLESCPCFDWRSFPTYFFCDSSKSVSSIFHDTFPSYHMLLTLNPVAHSLSLLPFPLNKWLLSPPVPFDNIPLLTLYFKKIDLIKEQNTGWKKSANRQGSLKYPALHLLTRVSIRTQAMVSHLTCFGGDKCFNCCKPTVMLPFTTRTSLELFALHRAK